jgi:CRISPR-associated exonuclease Cas4
MLRSLKFGLSGKADVVEFHLVSDDNPDGTKLEGVQGLWAPFPVEYKRGRLRHEREYEVQLCAQALCLEEMLNVHIPSGALYYGKTARRLEVAFNESLRKETEAAASRLHELYRMEVTPKARYQKKCDECSMFDLCLPKSTGTRQSVKRYLAQAIAKTSEETT